MCINMFYENNKYFANFIIIIYKNKKQKEIKIMFNK